MARMSPSMPRLGETAKIERLGGEIELVHLDERELEYRWVRGGHETPVIVMLHEGLGSVSTWRDFPEAVGEVTCGDVLVYRAMAMAVASAERGVFRRLYASRRAGRTAATLDALEAWPQRWRIIALIWGAIRGVRGLIVEAPHVFTEQVSVGIARNPASRIIMVCAAGWSASRRPGCEFLRLERGLAIA